MAFAVWRVIWQPPSPVRNLAIALFFVQLALNAAWSWMFFAAESSALGLANIVPQFLAVVATFVAFLRVDRTAGYVLAPLVGWVFFASVLNASVWWLNG
jgi:tryptophan-rich sensory protein